MDQQPVTRIGTQAFTCPVCENAFQARVVEAVAHQGQDSDFYPHYLGENPLPFFLVQCPSCR